MSWSVWQEKPFPITILWLDASSKCTRKGVEANHYFPPLSPFGITALFKKDIYWAMHFLVHLWHQAWLANQSNPKKREEEEKGKGGKKKRKWRQPLKNSFWALYCSSLTVLFQLTGLGYFENFLSIIAGIFMCQLFHRKKYASSLTCCLKPPMFNTSIENSMLDFFFPLAVLQLLSFCLAMQHTQKGTKQKIASMFNSRLASTESSAPHKSSAQKSHLLLEA